VSWNGNGENGALFSSSSKYLLDGATVVRLEDGVFNMIIGSSHEGPTSRNRGGAESEKSLRIAG